jgi:hypothetical protein
VVALAFVAGCTDGPSVIVGGKVTTVAVADRAPVLRCPTAKTEPTCSRARAFVRPYQSSTEIFLCPFYFLSRYSHRIRTLIHEAGHRWAGLRDMAYYAKTTDAWTSNGKSIVLTPQQHAWNADTHAYFATTPWARRRIEQ